MPSTKRAFMVRRAADIPGVIQQAFEIAVSGRPGPVLVDLPKSVLLEKAEPSYPAASGVASHPEAARVERERISGALSK